MTAAPPGAAGPLLAGKLAVPSVDPLDVAVPELLNGFAARTGPTVLVLDDLHEVTDSQGAGGVEFLLDHLPDALRVVVAGRTEPPVGPPRLRARGRLADLTTGDLRCTPAEARALLSAVQPGADRGPAAPSSPAWPRRGCSSARWTARAAGTGCTRCSGPRCAGGGVRRAGSRIDPAVIPSSVPPSRSRAAPADRDLPTSPGQDRQPYLLPAGLPVAAAAVPAGTGPLRDPAPGRVPEEAGR